MQPDRRTLAALALLMFTLAAYSGPTSSLGATPEAAIEQFLRQAEANAFPDTHLHVRVHGTRITPHGVVVLYTAEHRTDQARVVATRSNYAVLDRSQGQWLMISGGLSTPPDAATMPPVEFYQWPMDTKVGKASGSRPHARHLDGCNCRSAGPKYTD